MCKEEVSHLHILFDTWKPILNRNQFSHMLRSECFLNVRPWRLLVMNLLFPLISALHWVPTYAQESKPMTAAPILEVSHECHENLASGRQSQWEADTSGKWILFSRLSLAQWGRLLWSFLSISRPDTFSVSSLLPSVFKPTSVPCPGPYKIFPGNIKITFKARVTLTNSIPCTRTCKKKLTGQWNSLAICYVPSFSTDSSRRSYSFIPPIRVE